MLKENEVNMLEENMELKKIFSSPDPIETFFTIVFFINIIGLFICLTCYFIFWREINGIEYKNVTEIIKKLNSNNNFEAIKIKKYIEQAINDNKITKWEYDKIQDMINKYRKRKAKQEALQQIEKNINKEIKEAKQAGKIKGIEMLRDMLNNKYIKSDKRDAQTD